MYESLVGKCYKAKYYGYAEYVKINRIIYDDVADVTRLYDDSYNAGYVRVSLRIGGVRGNGEISLYGTEDGVNLFVEVTQEDYDAMKQRIIDDINGL